MSIQFDLNKTLEVLERSYWEEPTFITGLITRCHQLRRVPLKRFSTGNLRVMILQKIGLEYLIPLALKRLKKYPLTEGDYYRGDLLNSVIAVNKEFWLEYPEYGLEAYRIVKRLFSIGQKKQRRFAFELKILRGEYINSPLAQCVAENPLYRKI